MGLEIAVLVVLFAGELVRGVVAPPGINRCSPRTQVVVLADGIGLAGNPLHHHPCGTKVISQVVLESGAAILRVNGKPAGGSVNLEGT